MRAKTIEKINKIIQYQKEGKAIQEIADIMQYKSVQNLRASMNGYGYILGSDGIYIKKPEPEIDGQLSIDDTAATETAAASPEVIKVEIVEDTTNSNTNSITNTDTTNNTTNSITTMLQQPEQANKLLELIVNADEILELLNKNKNIDTTTIELTFDIRDKYILKSFKVSEKVFERWSEFKNDYPEYKIQELLSQALTDFMDKHQINK